MAVGNVERVVTAGLATTGGTVGMVPTSVELATPGLAVRGSRKGSESCRADRCGASGHGEAMEDSARINVCRVLAESGISCF